jgi:hypothetical protein
VYDTAGFLPYLQFDGLSWSMGTNSIDPGAIDKAQVFAGVRKLSDALFNTIAEFGNTDTTNGTFAAYSSTGAARYGAYVRGTAQGRYQPETYAAPKTDVLSMQNNLAGVTVADCVIPRVNGVVEQENLAGVAAGGGNFGNHPLYLGGRTGTSLYLNGWLSSLIVRFGANLTQSQIEATESWVNGKTGAY